MFERLRDYNKVGNHCARALVRLGTDVGQFIPMVFDGVEVRALCRPVKLFLIDLDKPFLYGPGFVHGGMSLYAVALRFSFTGTKGPSPNHEKQPQTIKHPPPNFTLGIMRGAGSFLLAARW